MTNHLTENERAAVARLIDLARKAPETSIMVCYLRAVVTLFTGDNILDGAKIDWEPNPAGDRITFSIGEGESRSEHRYIRFPDDDSFTPAVEFIDGYVYANEKGVNSPEVIDGDVYDGPELIRETPPGEAPEMARAFIAGCWLTI